MNAGFDSLTFAQVFPVSSTLHKPNDLSGDIVGRHKYRVTTDAEHQG